MTGERFGLRLRLERVVPAAPERVFAACVDPDELARWWGPAGFTAPSVELDVREGSGYRIRMQPPEGEAFHLRGEFLEVEPPRCLVYTFEWEEPDPDDRVTTVTLTFVREADGTAIVVEQGKFATEGRLELHTQGWTEALERLERHLADVGSV